MNRTLLVMALVALIAPSAPCLAQPSSGLPVIRPRVRELGEFRDTTLRAELTPQEAVLSPRGTLVAYSTVNDLRIWNVSTHSSRVILKGWSDNIAWSPAGDAIAFHHEGDQGSSELIWMLRVNPVTGESNGSPQRVSLTATTDAAPQFSPDGKSIAFRRRDLGEHSSLVVVPAAGGTERVLASGYGIDKLRWAADGSAIYHAVYQDSAKVKSMLERAAVNGGASQLVHVFTGERRAPTLSADNRVLMFSGALTAGAETMVRISDLNGRGLATLSIPTGVEVSDWSGEYRRAGVRVTTPRGLRIVNVADGRSRDLIDSTADVQAVTWFEDNRRIAAIVFHAETGVLVTMNADGSGMRKMPLAVQPFRNPTVGHGLALTLRVSPDGRYAVYQGPGRHSLELVDLSTGKQKTLARADVIAPPVWLRDSRTIRYHRIDDVALTDPGWRGVHDVSLDGTDKLVRAFPHSKYPRAAWIIGENYVSIFGENTTSLARLDGGPDQLLLRGSTRMPGIVSPNGRTYAVSPGPISSTKPAHKVILLSLSDGSQRTVELAFAEIDCVTFSPDGRYLYCRGREADSGPQTLYEVPVDGSKPRVVTRIDSREFMGASVLSPDGKWLLQTVAGVRRTAFVSLDFSEGMARLASPPRSTAAARVP